MIYTDDNYINGIIRRRNPDAHKGDFGKVLIYAGSPGMAGAAVLCARSALKSGAGLVQLLLPDFSSMLLPVFQISVPEATCMDYSRGIKLSDYDAVITGSGLGTGNDGCRIRILSDILDNYNGIVVLDADALNLISRNTELSDKVRNCPAQVIITPHTGEARRLLHTQAPVKDEESRIQAALDLSGLYNCIAVLKGAGTLVASEALVFKNTTGNPGMATAGSGDSLAGIIGSLAAQGYIPLDAARAGVFIHGKAGDLAAASLGEMGVTSSDIVENIPFALRQYYD